MKKLIFTLLVSGQAFLSFGQARVNHPPMKQYNVSDENTAVNTRLSNSSLGKAAATNWYEHLSWVQASPLGAGLTRSAFFITNDSLFKVVDDDGTIRSANFMAIGHTLDPKDAALDLTSNPGLKMSKFNAYTLDSIYFRYLYVRLVDSINNAPVVDTVFIAYYKGTSQIQQTNYTGGAKDKVSIVDWNTAKKMPANYTELDTFLISSYGDMDFDTTNVSNSNGGFQNAWGTKITSLKAPANFNAAANSQVGFTVTFKSGIPAVIGTDTAVIVYEKDPSTLPPGTRRANYFGALYWANNKETGTAWSNPTYFNSHQFQPMWNAYGQSANWKDNFVAGSAFTADLFVQTGFLLSSTNVGVEDIKNNEFAMTNVYPNPTTTGTGALVAFNLVKESNVDINIVNLFGQTVQTISNTYPSGKQTIEVNLSNIKPGVYFFNMTVNGTTETKKLTITQ